MPMPFYLPNVERISDSEVFIFGGYQSDKGPLTYTLIYNAETGVYRNSDVPDLPHKVYLMVSMVVKGKLRPEVCGGDCLLKSMKTTDTLVPRA